MVGLDDPGLDRLRARMLDRVAAPGPDRRPDGGSLLAANAAAQPDLSIDSLAVLSALAPDTTPGVDELARRMFVSLHGLLLARGVDGETATAQARRTVAALLLEVAGHDQLEAARRLGVTDRTLRNDRALLRTIDREELFA